MIHQIGGSLMHQIRQEVRVQQHSTTCQQRPAMTLSDQHLQRDAVLETVFQLPLQSIGHHVLTFPWHVAALEEDLLDAVYSF